MYHWQRKYSLNPSLPDDVRSAPPGISLKKSVYWMWVDINDNLRKQYETTFTGPLTNDIAVVKQKGFPRTVIKSIFIHFEDTFGCVD